MVDRFVTKVIKWRAPDSELAEDVTVLLQNANGPCPLVALANTVILKEEPQIQGTSLRAYTSGKDEILLDSLIPILAEILLQSSQQHETDSVLSVLPGIVTGLNVDIRFDGSFSEGPETALFACYDIGLLHGWVCSPNDPSWPYLKQAVSYDQAQSVLLRASEPEPDESTSAIATAIHAFTLEYPTQLSPFGLENLLHQLPEGGLAVLFRNNHLSTLHKRNGTLYTLVTDEGFRREHAITWTSLTSISGSEDLFYDAEFLPASGSEPPAPPSPVIDEQDVRLARELQEQEDSAYAARLSRRNPPAKKAKKGCLIM